MANFIDPTTKEQVLSAVKQEGISVSDASARFGVKPATIYYWLGSGTDNTHTSILEVNKLRAENKALKELLGLFALEKEQEIQARNRISEKAKKNPYRS